MLDSRCDRPDARPAVRWIRAVAMLAATSVFALANAGCAGNCATGCPTLEFDVVATAGENLDLASAQWSGPACSVVPPGYCAPDPYDSNNTCVRIAIIAVGEGTCRLDLTFKDGRAAFSGTATFGPETHQGCCRGFPVMGATSATVPPLHPLPMDAGSDQDAAPDTGMAGQDTADAAPAADDAGSG